MGGGGKKKGARAGPSGGSRKTERAVCCREVAGSCAPGRGRAGRGSGPWAGWGVGWGVDGGVGGGDGVHAAVSTFFFVVLRPRDHATVATQPTPSSTSSSLPRPSADTPHMRHLPTSRRLDLVLGCRARVRARKRERTRGTGERRARVNLGLPSRSLACARRFPASPPAPLPSHTHPAARPHHANDTRARVTGSGWAASGGHGVLWGRGVGKNVESRRERALSLSLTSPPSAPLSVFLTAASPPQRVLARRDGAVTPPLTRTRLSALFWVGRAGRAGRIHTG